MKKNNAWSLYWQGNNQESCIATNESVDGLILSTIWSKFTKKLDSHAKVLDLATGNGSVPIKLLAVNEQLNITGVDYADIAPSKYVSNNTLLVNVEFLPNVDIAQLPFEDCSFDVITSQFGFEYSHMIKASVEFIRVLKPKGKFLFVMHHENSEIVNPARRKLLELELLCQSQGILDKLKLFIDDQIKLDVLETIGQTFFSENKGNMTQEITGNLFSAVNQLINFKEQGYSKQQLLSIHDDVQLRVLAEKSRLEQLVLASLSEANIISFCQNIESSGANIFYNSIAMDDGAILAWQVEGCKI